MKKIFWLAVIILAFGCSKEKTYLYQVNQVTTSQTSGNKSTAKTTTEFISIAYSDLFPTTISNAKLIELNTAYSSFGDKKLIEDRIIRQFLADTVTILLPTKQAMRNDISYFITKSYNKFFNRAPTEFEKNYLKNHMSQQQMMQNQARNMSHAQATAQSANQSMNQSTNASANQTIAVKCLTSC